MKADSGKELAVGFAAIARETFDMERARAVTAQARSALKENGLSLKGPEAPLAAPEQAEAAVRELSGEELDLLLVFQATFADSQMAVRFAESVAAPLLFWMVPEPPSGGRLRLNSYCGVNLAAHALRRKGIRYQSMFLPADDAAAPQQVREAARAGRVINQLRRTKIGRLGVHPDGFATCQVNPASLKERLGVEVKQYELREVFEKVEGLKPEQTARLRTELNGRLEALDQMDQAAVNRTLGGYRVLHQLVEQDGLDGLAVRCWPEFFTELGGAACGALSLLSEELIPASCEADVNGLVTQLILQRAAAAPVFDSDIVAHDEQNDAVVFWHCGKAPLSMADPQAKPCATVHSNRRLPLLMEFPLKPGPVTVVRLSEATGQYRLVLGKGEMLRGDKSFSGTSGRCRFPVPAKQVMEQIVGEGLEHHVTLAYGDHTAVLRRAAGMLELPVLELGAAAP